MELISWRQWYSHGPIIISLLCIALTLWSNRKSAPRTGTQYAIALAGLVAVAMAVAYLFAEPQIPLVFRSLSYLALALLAIMIVVTWPRKKT